MTSVNEALKGFRDTFDERMRAMEDTCKALVEHADLRASTYKAEIEQLQDRVSELELALARTEQDSNLICCGVVESPSEDAKKVFLKTCQETMNVLVTEGGVR